MKKASLLIILMIFLMIFQIYLSKKKSKVLGIIIPFTTFVLSIFMIIMNISGDVVMSVEEMTYVLTKVVIIFNIPTFVFIFIYVYYKAKLKRVKK